MNMIENLIVGVLYLPMLIAPVAMLFWYAFSPSSRSESKNEVESRK